MHTLTAAELGRAKRWAAMQVPQVTVEKNEYGEYLCQNVPNWLRYYTAYSWERVSEDSAWRSLDRHLEPVFASIAPVIETEVHDRWERAVGHGITTAEELASMS